MDRVFKSGASATPPAPPVSPSVGYAIGGDPGTGTPATKPGAYWYHMITESLRRLLVASGLTPDHTNLDQVTLAVQELIRQAAADYKPSVRVATTANITALNGGAPNTLDGVTLVAGDRILVKDQTTGSQNGLYVVTTLGTGANGTWSRAGDADAAGELTSGAVVAVEEGSSNADTQWMLTTNDPITLGVTALVFTKQGGVPGDGFPSVGATVAANALTVTIAPETLDFRASTLTSGVPITRQAIAQGSLTVPSGATLGMVSGQQARLVWGWLDNAGTLEPFIGNLSGGVNLDETTRISTTAMSGSSNSAGVLYSAVARTNCAFRLRGFCDITQAVAGTHATNPTLVQPVGGQALAALSSLGYNQTPQNVTGSRSAGVTYYNTTGKPFDFATVFSNGGSPFTATQTVNGVSISAYYYTGSGGVGMMTVPPGGSYSASGATLSTWVEQK